MWYHHRCCRLLGFRVVRRGRPESWKAPILFVSNHCSYLDITVLGSLGSGLLRRQGRRYRTGRCSAPWPSSSARSSSTARSVSGGEPSQRDVRRAWRPETASCCFPKEPAATAIGFCLSRAACFRSPSSSPGAAGRSSCSRSRSPTPMLDGLPMGRYLQALLRMVRRYGHGQPFVAMGGSRPLDGRGPVP